MVAMLLMTFMSTSMINIAAKESANSVKQVFGNRAFQLGESCIQNAYIWLKSKPINGHPKFGDGKKAIKKPNFSDSSPWFLNFEKDNQKSQYRGFQYDCDIENIGENYVENQNSGGSIGTNPGDENGTELNLVQYYEVNAVSDSFIDVSASSSGVKRAEQEIEALISVIELK